MKRTFLFLLTTANFLLAGLWGAAENPGLVKRALLAERERLNRDILLGKPSEFSARWAKYLNQNQTITVENVKIFYAGERFYVEPLSGSSRAVPAGPVSSGKRLALGQHTLVLTVQSGLGRVVLYDPNLPKKRGFRGLHYFPVNLRYRVHAELHPDSKPEPITMLTSRGLKKNYLKYGSFAFSLDGKPLRLSAFVEADDFPNPRKFFVPFRDATSGHESYAVMRYVDVRAPHEPGQPYILDFNKAYNPSCAYGISLFNCPIPPPENILPLAVRAGEKKYHP